VGLGAVAQAVHLPLLSRRSDLFAIHALCDLSSSLLETLGERYRVPRERRFTSIDGLLETGIDAVIVLTSGSHAEPALAALGAGLPVFCEKPLAYTLAEADKVIVAGGRLALGYMKLYDPAVVRARELLDERELRAVEMTVLHSRPASQLAHAHVLPPAAVVPAEVLVGLRADSDQLAAEALGAAASDLGRLYTDVLLGSIVHQLALVRLFAGDPLRIDHVDVWPEQQWPPSVAIEALLARGTRLSIRWHYLDDFPAHREEVRLYHEAGTIALTFPSPYLLNAPTELVVVEADGSGERLTRYRSTVEAFEEELVDFHSLVTGGTPTAAGAAAGRADIVTCQRIARRLAEQRGIALGGDAAGA
jgi:myo-inositol 2-dehydrogenase / D-chiro-inositol 1-dehydrogenase